LKTMLTLTAETTGSKLHSIMLHSGLNVEFLYSSFFDASVNSRVLALA
jgi:hypothetical protein